MDQRSLLHHPADASHHLPGPALRVGRKGPLATMGWLIAMGSLLQAQTGEPVEEQETALPHDFLDPSSHLPGLPAWVYWLGALLALVIIAGSVILYRRLNKKNLVSSPGRNPLRLALARIHELKEQSETLALPELATELSLTLRRYLADTKSDRALFQTREEFIANQRRLNALPEDERQKLTDFIMKLSQYQYAPPASNEEEADQLITASLERLNALSSNPTDIPTHD
ncbi:MAG: DUF4381 family protein [Verrucomicrobiota bacterium JB023]|nr:DUF4381 family protein [Verrucomicrobiota bacterium JB023]